MFESQRRKGGKYHEVSKTLIPKGHITLKVNVRC